MAVDDIDYRALASRLRVVHRLRAERLERERDARGDDQLSLDRTLDALQAKPDLLDGVEQALRAAVRATEGIEPEPFSVGLFPVPLADPFLDGVLDYYRDQWDFKLDPTRLPQAVVTGLAKVANDAGLV